MRDRFLGVRLLGPQSFNAAGDTTGPAVELGGVADVAVVCLSATVTAGSIAVSAIEGSDDGTTWSAYPPESIFGALPSLNASGAASVVVDVAKRYMRAKVTCSGGTVNIVGAVTAAARKLVTA